MSKSLTNKLLLKKRLYGLKMVEGLALDQHINVFNKIISDMNRVDVKFEEEDMVLISPNSLLESYDNLVTTLMWGKETVGLEEITGALLFFNKRKKASDRSSQSEGLMEKGNRERGINKFRSESSRNKSQSKSRRRKDILVLQVWEIGAHKTRMSRMEEREHIKQKGFIKVHECSRRRRLRER